MKSYDRVLAAVYATPWAIEPNKGQVIADFLGRKVRGEDVPAADVQAAKDKNRGKGKPRSATVGVIPVYGTITQRADLFSEFSGGTSAEQVGLWVDEFAADPAVDAIVLDVDSPGGSVYGVGELGAKIAAAARAKKVIAVANSLAASAAYWIASQASELVITPGGEVGSIGVYVMHTDKSEELAKAGRRVTLISAGELKTAGHSYGPLGDAGRGVLQKSVDDYYDQFVRAVAAGRKVSPSAVRSGFGRGDTVRAEEAVRLGMADRIGTLDSVLGRYGLSTADLTPHADGEGPAPVAAPARKSLAAADPEIERRRQKLHQVTAGAEASLDVEIRRRRLWLANYEAEALQKRSGEAPVAVHLPAGRTAERDREVCLHEAGHVAAIIATGGRPFSVTVNPTEDGYAGLVTWNGNASDADRMLVCYAGPVAAGTEIDGQDLEKANRISSGAHAHRVAREQARRLVSRNWPAIHTLANELAVCRTLTGAEAAAICGRVSRW